MLTRHEQISAHPKFSEETLHVITPIINTKRFASRYRLFHEFAQYMLADRNVNLVPIELAFGERDHVLGGQMEYAQTIEVRGSHELWLKENLINVAATRLPYDWKYLAWIDADVKFAREDWALETLHQLQHYSVVQMFSHAQDLGPSFEPLGNPLPGFVYEAEKNGGLTANDQGNYLQHGHPGYAWAIRRDAFNGVGGLLDTAIAGAGDRHMALAMYGRAHHPIPGSNPPPGYMEPIILWQERALRVIKKNVGYVPGMLHHYFHGAKSKRKYRERWAILRDNNYDPKRDIVRDSQGVWQLSGENIGLRNDLRRYFSQRDEDSITV